jgi:hypothetical protein
MRNMEKVYTLSIWLAWQDYMDNNNLILQNNVESFVKIFITQIFVTTKDFCSQYALYTDCSKHSSWVVVVCGKKKNTIANDEAKQ